MQYHHFMDAVGQMHAFVLPVRQQRRLEVAVQCHDREPATWRPCEYTVTRKQFSAHLRRNARKVKTSIASKIKWSGSEIQFLRPGSCRNHVGLTDAKIKP